MKRIHVESLNVARAKLTALIETHAKLASFALNALVVEFEAAVREDERDVIAAAAHKMLETKPAPVTAPIAGVAPEHAFKPTAPLDGLVAPTGEPTAGDYPDITIESNGAPIAVPAPIAPSASSKKKQKHK